MAVTYYPDLKRALFDWVKETLDLLLKDGRARYLSTEGARWERDSDGIFRRRERSAERWAPFLIEHAQCLPSWLAVMDVVDRDSSLSGQVSVLVGTIQGGIRIEASQLFEHCLPLPAEVAMSDEIFNTRYGELDAYLGRSELEYCSIWPLPCTVTTPLPLELEPAVEVDTMSDGELSAALNTGLVRPVFHSMDILMPGQEPRICLRCSYSLSKLIGGGAANAKRAEGERGELEDRLVRIQSSFEESCALASAGPILTLGRFNIVSDRYWTPFSGGVSYGEFNVPRRVRFGAIEIDNNQAAEIKSAWRDVRRPGLLERQKGLGLALRRLSYQAQRERSEDELLDVMIAAEALYLSDLHNETYRGELRYRLALRAALLADSSRDGLSRRQVFELLKSAYDARSKIAHGGSADPKTLKVQGSRVSLSELVATTRRVLASGCRAALVKAASDEGWPPDWDALTFGDYFPRAGGT
jgi:hypothetical protein